MTQLRTLRTNPWVDERAAKITEWLFGFQSPEDCELPKIPWDLFEIDYSQVPPPRYHGLMKGEGLAGLKPFKDGKFDGVFWEVAHGEGLGGYDTGPMGGIFGNALNDQDFGQQNLFAIANPNLAIKPATMLITKIETNTEKRANQVFGPVAAAVSDAVIEFAEHGGFPVSFDYDAFCITYSPFVHMNAGAVMDANGKKPQKDSEGKLVMFGGDSPEFAISNHRLYCLNKACMLSVLWNMFTGGRSPQAIVEARRALKAGHLMRGFTPKSEIVVPTTPA